MAEDFDPYHDWLGIREAARPLSHYQLLGVPEFEENTLAIAVAADAAIARLKNTNPGGRGGRWQQLMDELMLARLCLSNRSRKLQYDVQLRERRGITAETATTTVSSVETVIASESNQSAEVQAAPGRTDFYPPSYQATVAAAPTQQVPVPGFSEVATPQAATVMPTGQPAAAPYATPVYSAPVYAGVAAMPAMGAPVGYPTMVVAPRPQVYVPMQLPVGTPAIVAPVVPVQAVSSPIAAPAPVEAAPLHQVPAEVFASSPLVGEDIADTFAAVGDKPSASTAFAPVSLSVATPGVSSSSRRTSWSPDATSMGIFGAVAFVVLTAILIVQRSSNESPELSQNAHSSKPRNAATDAVPPSTQPPVNDAAPEPKESKVAVIEPAKPEPRPEKPKTEVAQIEPDMEEPAPEPTPEPEPAAPAQTPEQKAAFEKALKNARAAMGARKLPRAKEELATAKANVGTAEQDQQLARMDELYGYVEGFWKAVVEALKGLQATDTLPIDNTEIAIVEVDEQSITIRAAGRNMSYTLADMPSGLATALAKRWFDMGMPANLLFMGAFHAVDAKGDPEQARQYWQDATRGGASAESLMPLLDESTAPLVAEQGDVPQKSVIAKARQALRTSMPEEFRAAKTLEKKRSLARELLDMAKQNDNEIERYVLYDEALSLAGAAGSAADMNAAIDGLAAWYKIDTWELRAKAFSDAAEDANNPLVAKALARELIEIVDKAIAENRPAEAARLSNAALSTARKGKDLELVKQATERKAKLAAPE